MVAGCKGDRYVYVFEEDVVCGLVIVVETGPREGSKRERKLCGWCCRFVAGGIGK